MTSKYQKLNLPITTDRIFIKIEAEAQVAKPKPKMLEIKTTSDGRQPQNIISSQKQLFCFSSNFKLKIRGSNQNQRGLKLRQPPMEDDLNILKVECLKPLIGSSSNFNWSSGDQTQMKIAWNEDNLPWRTTSKYFKLNISETTDWIFHKF